MRQSLSQPAPSRLVVSVAKTEVKTSIIFRTHIKELFGLTRSPSVEYNSMN